MPTAHTRRRAYNIVPGDKVTILGALHGDTALRPHEWRVKAIEDHDPETFLNVGPAGLGLKLVRQPATRTFTLTNSNDPKRGQTYQYTVNRDQQIVVVP